MSCNRKIKMMAVVGPTASGKTAFSVELAKKNNGEIISADSMQIYKEMSIGTAKPTLNEMQGIPHHMIDFLHVNQDFSVAQYVQMARKCIEDVVSRGKVPILCGGTGLYVDSLLNNISFAKANVDFELREKLYQQSEQYGGQILLDELMSIDPEYGSRLHPNNVRRIIRAIELYRVTGMTMTEQNQHSREEDSLYDVDFIGLKYADRDILYDRINKRVDVMMARGLLQETIEVFELNPSKTAREAIGYKELYEYMNGETTLEAAVEKIKTASRHYAKRQLTWFRRNDAIRWINMN